jgi:hypothetical protein
MVSSHEKRRKHYLVSLGIILSSLVLSRYISLYRESRWKYLVGNFIWFTNPYLFLSSSVSLWAPLDIPLLSSTVGVSLVFWEFLLILNKSNISSYEDLNGHEHWNMLGTCNTFYLCFCIKTITKILFAPYDTLYLSKKKFSCLVMRTRFDKFQCPPLLTPMLCLYICVQYVST